MWRWIKFSFRIWAAYWTAWLVINLTLAVSVAAILAMIGLLDLLLQ